MKAPIGLQLYSVREAASQDFDDTLKRVANIGYLGVELAGFTGTTPEKAAKLLEELGLTITSGHFGAPIGEKKNEILEIMAATKCPCLVIPYQPREGFESRDGIRKICDVLNESCEVGKEHNFTVGYHNHWWEAEYKVDGKPAYQVMLEYLDPAVTFQVDTYWMKTGGLDPAKVIADLGNRAPLIHIKDGPAKKDELMTAVGKGILDWDSIIAAGNGFTKWLIVEIDACAMNMIEAVNQSYQYLTKEGFARGRH